MIMLVLNVEVKWIKAAITLQLNHSHDCMIVDLSLRADVGYT